MWWREELLKKHEAGKKWFKDLKERMRERPVIEALRIEYEEDELV